MAEVIVFRDAVAAVLVYLTVELAALGETAELHKNIPLVRPDRFVRVLRTGGPRRNLVVDDAQITIEAWAATDADAHDLAQLVRGCVNSMEYAGAAHRVEELSGPVDLPDPDSNQSRHTWSVVVSLRGVTI